MDNLQEIGLAIALALVLARVVGSSSPNSTKSIIAISSKDRTPLTYQTKSGSSTQREPVRKFLKVSREISSYHDMMTVRAISAPARPADSLQRLSCLSGAINLSTSNLTLLISGVPEVFGQRTW